MSSVTIIMLGHVIEAASTTSPSGELAHDHEFESVRQTCQMRLNLEHAVR